MRKYIALALAILSVLSVLASCRSIDSDLEGTTAKDTTEQVADDTTDAETTEKNETILEDTTEIDTTIETGTKVTEIKLDKYKVEISVGGKDMPWVTMLPENAPNKAEIWESSNTKVATVDKYGNITGVAEGKCTVTVTSADNKKVSAKVDVTVTKAIGVTYIQGILIANKSYSLPSDYNPGIDKTANDALNKMISAAKQEGVNLWIASGFRSYDRQNTLYNNYVARDGKAAADTYSARPGHSEHQTGLAFDLNSLEQSFGETKEGKWLAANSWKYGFIIRYPKGKEAITGYIYEPWHVRYLGEDVAKKVYDSGLCLEEYLGIKSVYAD